MNTAEMVSGFCCGTVAFLGLAIGYPWLCLHYAGTGVLKLARPTQSKPKPTTAAEPAGDTVKAAA